MNKKSRKEELKKIAEDQELVKIAQQADAQSGGGNHSDKVFDLLLERLIANISIPELDE